jgi:hypothetical protein
MNDYAIPYDRKSKKQQKLKRKFRVYKRGGAQRTQNIPTRA